MFKKLFLCAVVLFFSAEHIVHGLRCDTCTSPEECQKSSIVKCDNTTAYATSLALAKYYVNVPKVNGSLSYYCSSDANLDWDHNIVTYIQGCTFNDYNICSLRLRENFSEQIRTRSCMIMSGYSDENNGQGGPAGTYSNSLFIVMATTLRFILSNVLD